MPFLVLNKLSWLEQQHWNYLLGGNHCLVAERVNFTSCGVSQAENRQTWSYDASVSVTWITPLLKILVQDGSCMK